MRINKKFLGVISAGVVASVLLTAGSCDGGSGAQTAQEKKAESQDTLLKKWETDPDQAYPENALGNSLDRKNLVERLKRNNDSNRISYLYVLSNTGLPVGYFVIKGKISSTESSLLPTDSIAHPCSYSDCYFPMEGVGDDGTYGSNENAVFGYTAQGVMVTIRSENWIQADAPIALNIPDLTPKK